MINLRVNVTNNIFNIATNYSFCKTIHRFVKDNYKEVNKLTIFLPSQRLCRELKEVFLAESYNSFLPKIKALTDIDYNDFWLIDAKSSSIVEEIRQEIEDCLQYKILNDLDEVFYIAKLVQKTKLFGENDNLHYSLKIAQNFREIFNELEYENIDESKLKLIDDSNLAAHRQITLSFLQDFYLYIKNSILKDKILLSSSYYVLIIRKFCQLIANHNLQSPIIIAGSTGSIKINQFFINSIQEQSQVKIILSNFQEVKNHLEVHPQYFNQNLINSINYQANKIQNINYDDFQKSASLRRNLAENIFVLADEIRCWNNINDCDKQSIKNDIAENFTVIEAKDKYDEARKICQIIAKFCEKNRIGIISNDEDLTNILRYQLIANNIVFNDTIAHRISNSKLINFLQLIIDFNVNNFNASSFLGIVKNKFCRYSSNYSLIKEFELKIIRQQRSSEGLQGIIDKLSKENNEHLNQFWNSFYSSFSAINFAKQKLSDHIQSIIKTLEEITDKNFLDLVNSQECAIEIFDLFTFLSQKDDFYCSFSEIRDVIESVISDITYFKKTKSDLNVSLMTSIEARLIDFDVIIITDLNDKSFPKSRNENWLGQKIRKDLGIDRSKKQIGQNAYDFCHYLSSKKVILSRSLANDGVKKAPSQFLLRFNLFCHFIDASPEIIKYQIANNLITRSPDTENGYKYDVKINSISVTDLVKLIKDPYHIYAKKILKLEELNAIDYQPSFKEFGSFIHEVLENFVNDKDGHINNFREIFNKYFQTNASEILWWSKFDKILNNFISLNQQYKEFKNYTELKVEDCVENIKIIGKIDRIMIDDENNFIIADYKTGSVPIKKDVKNGTESQLAILAHLLKNHHIFAEKLNKEPQISDLQYWKISTNSDNSKISKAVKSEEIENLLNQVELNLSKLIKHYFVEDNNFESRNNKEMSSYNHVARKEI